LLSEVRERPVGRRDLALVLVAILMLAVTPVAAQVQAPLQVTIDQNAIMRQYAPPPTRPPSLGGRMSLPVAGISAEHLAETRFRLTAVDLEGVVTLDPAIFTSVWQPLIGKEISLLDLKTVLDGIENVYARNDYQAKALAPAQDFASGRIKIVVYEIYIRDLIVKGDIARLRERLDPVLARITAMRPVRISETYRYLLLVEDLAGISIQADLTGIDDEPGAGRMELNITFKPGTLNIGLDNFGGKDVGPLQGSAASRLNDVFGLFESTDLLVVTNPVAPQELTFVSLAQNVPLGFTGFSFSYGVGHSWSSPGGPSRDLRFYSEVSTANVGLNYALLRSNERNVIVTAALNGNNSNVDILETPVIRDRTRWASFGFKYDDAIGGVRFILNPALLHGIDAFGSNVQTTDYAAATISGVAATNFTETLSAKLQFNGQYAFNRLPAAVLGYYGGQVFGRAYDPGAVAGNSAVAAAFELSQRIDTKVSWLPGFSLFAYADYGAVWNPPGVGYEFASLSSLGFGIRTGIGEHLIASALVAQPLWYDVELAALGVEQSTRYRFTVALRF
jgi:hemolysin activation/secretion protein